MSPRPNPVVVEVHRPLRHYGGVSLHLDRYVFIRAHYPVHVHGGPGGSPHRNVLRLGGAVGEHVGDVGGGSRRPGVHQAKVLIEDPCPGVALGEEEGAGIDGEGLCVGLPSTRARGEYGYAGYPRDRCVGCRYQGDELRVGYVGTGTVRTVPPDDGASDEAGSVDGQGKVLPSGHLVVRAQAGGSGNGWVIYHGHGFVGIIRHIDLAGGGVDADTLGAGAHPDGCRHRICSAVYHGYDAAAIRHIDLVGSGVDADANGVAAHRDRCLHRIIAAVYHGYGIALVIHHIDLVGGGVDVDAIWLVAYPDGCRHRIRIAVYHGYGAAAIIRHIDLVIDRVGSDVVGGAESRYSCRHRIIPAVYHGYGITVGIRHIDLVGGGVDADAIGLDAYPYGCRYCIRIAVYHGYDICAPQIRHIYLIGGWVDSDTNRVDAHPDGFHHRIRGAVYHGHGMVIGIRHIDLVGGGVDADAVGGGAHRYGCRHCLRH